MDDGNITVTIPVEHPKCEGCKFCLENPRDYHCCKFRFKPNEVLYEGLDCEKFEESDIKENEDEEDEEDE